MSSDFVSRHSRGAARPGFCGGPSLLFGRRCSSISQETNIRRRPVKMIVAAIEISNRCCGQFVGVYLVEQLNLDRVENATHRFELAAPRRANATNFAEMKLEPRYGASWRDPLIVGLGFSTSDETK